MFLERSASAQATQAGSDKLHHPTAAPVSPPERAAATRSESTELERRVLAHERILQALIAQMAESEPKFLARLSDTFCVPIAMTRSEHDYTDTESYAADFVRSAVSLGEKAAWNASAAARARPARKGAPPATARDGGAPTEPPQILMTHVNSIWRITIDGRFYGDFIKEHDAAAAVAAYRGGFAQTS